MQYTAVQERLTARGKQNFRGEPPYAEFKQNSESQCQAASAPQNRSTCISYDAPSVTPSQRVNSRETTTAKARRWLGTAVSPRLRQRGKDPSRGAGEPRAGLQGRQAAGTQGSRSKAGDTGRNKALVVMSRTIDIRFLLVGTLAQRVLQRNPWLPSLAC